MTGNQRFVLLLAAMTLIGIAMMRVAPAQQAAPSPVTADIIRAQRIEIVDREGKVRAVLGENPQQNKGNDNDMGLTLNDTNGKPRAELTLSASDMNSPSLILSDNKTNSRILLRVSDIMGASDITLIGNKDGQYADFQVSDDGSWLDLTRPRNEVNKKSTTGWVPRQGPEVPTYTAGLSLSDRVASISVKNSAKKNGVTISAKEKGPGIELTTMGKSHMLK